MKKALFSLLLSLLVLAAGPLDAVRSEGAGRKLTLMVYMCGSNLESGYGAASADIEEMKAAAPKGREVTVLVMTGGAEQWSQGYDPAQCLIHEIGPRGTRVVWRSEALNMGAPETLTFFIDWCAASYPAERMDLVFWDHGGGPMMGLCADQLHHDDMLTLPELSAGLRGSCLSGDRRLELIGFDACMMSTVEVAAICAPYARYMIASEELESRRGWDYHYLENIKGDATGADTGRRIISAYFEANADIQAAMTLCCLDLTRMFELQNEMDALFSNLSLDLTARTYASISHIRDRSAGIARATGADYDLVDLGGLLNHLNEMSGGKAQKALDALGHVCVDYHGTDDRLHGMSVYYPFYNKSRYRDDWQYLYSDISAAKGYASYVKRFGRYLTGASFERWLDLQTRLESADDDGYNLTLQLTENQMKHFSSARVIIMQKSAQDDTYAFIYETHDVTMDEQGLLTARYDNTALFPVDSQGKLLSDSVRFYLRDGFYVIPCTLWPENEITQPWAHNVELVCSPDPQQPGFLRVRAAYLLEENGLTTMLDLRDWVRLALFYKHRRLSRDADGQVMPFDECEKTGFMYGYTVELSELEGFAIQQGEQSEAVRYASFQITDTQNNQYGSEPAELPNQKLVSVLATPQVMLDNEDLKITLTSVSYSPDAVFNQGVVLNYEIINRRKESIIKLSAGRYAINRRYLLNEWRGYPVYTEKTFVCREILPFSELSLIGIERIDLLSMRWEVKWETQQQTDYDVELPVNLELAGYLKNEFRPPLAESGNDGILMALQAVQYEPKEQTMMCRIRLVNDSGRPFSFQKTNITYAINGCEFTGGYMICGGVADDNGTVNIELPPGYETTFSLKLSGNNRSFFGNGGPEVCENYYDWYGIREVRSISLLIWKNQFEQEQRNMAAYCFELPEPVDIPEVTPADMPLLLDTENALVRLEKICIINPPDGSHTAGQVQLVTMIKNCSDQPLRYIGIGMADPEAWAVEKDMLMNENPIIAPNRNELANYMHELPPHMSVRAVMSIYFEPDAPKDAAWYAQLPLKELRFPFTYQLGDEIIHTTMAVLSPEEPVGETDAAAAVWSVVPARMP